MLAIDRRDRWALLTLDRPEQRNALSIALRDAVSDALDGLADDERIHGVAITGAGGAFSAGWDLREFAAARADPGLGERIWASGDRFHDALLGFPLPLVAAVNGPAIAGAFDLAVCCDVRVASTAARFAHPEFSWSDVVYAPLEAAVGGAVARDLLLTGRPLDAREALAVGLVSAVVEPAQLGAHLAEVMGRIAGAPRDALRRTKAKAIRRAAVEPAPTLQL